jgi:hypothetical protein
MSIFCLALVNGIDAHPASDAFNPNAEKCEKGYKQCYAQCQQENPAQTLKGDTARTACGSVCIAKRVSCMAGKSYDQAKPWGTDKIDKFNRFLNDLFQKPPVTPKEPKNNGIKNI